MMNTTVKHLLATQQPKLGGLAYWSTVAPMFNTNDRSSEINVGFREGDGYA